jgi:hypothetical protein
MRECGVGPMPGAPGFRLMAVIPSQWDTVEYNDCIYIYIIEGI